MRRRRRAPRFVWVSAHKADAVVTHKATVYIDPDDVPELLDLRFLVGLTALVEGQDDDPRVERLARCCAGIAKRVVCTVGHYERCGYEITRITDTQGEMTWHR